MLDVVSVVGRLPSAGFLTFGEEFSYGFLLLWVGLSFPQPDYKT